MANKVIILDAFARASFPHLDVPFAHDPKDVEKYRLQLMFTKEGVYNHPEVGEIESHPYELIDALNEVCQDEFDFAISEVENVAELKEEVGVQFPPSFKDGDKVKLKKDGRPVPGEYDPKTAGYWMINLTSDEKPGCVGPDENEIDPKTIYSGCWVRVQLEVSAYYNKQNNAPIVNIDLLNVQYCYDDESLGGKTPRPNAKTAFSGHAIKNSNVKSGTGSRMGKPAEGGRPTRPGADKPVRPSRPGADKPVRPTRPGADKPARPSRPGADKPAPKEEPVETELVSLGDFTVEEMLEDGWTEEELVEAGHAEYREVKKPAKPARPSRPAKKLPPKKPAKPVKKAGPKVVMFDDCEYTYEELINDNGWTDEDIVNAGYGEFDYTNPDA